MLQWLYTYVSSVGSKCFTCFRRMLQVFHRDVAKVYLDVAYICEYFKFFIRMLQLFSSGCLQWLHTLVSSFFWCFASVSDVCCKCRCNCFGCMLQVFRLDVTKVDLVLHMHARGSEGGTSGRHRKWSEERIEMWPCVGVRRRRKQSGMAPT
jgi:hypothetical protein